MSTSKTSDYSEKLKDPRWQKKRLEILQRDDWTCQACADNTKPLVVHHLQYLQGKEPWQYPSELLVTYCEDCHNTQYQLENQRNKTKSMLDCLSALQLQQIHDFLIAYIAKCDTYPYIESITLAKNAKNQNY